MQQFQKGYSVLENIPEDKELDLSNKIRPRIRKHEILWYWFIFALVTTLVIVWAGILLNFHSYRETHHHSSVVKTEPQLFMNTDDNVDPASVLQNAHDPNSENTLNPANILGDLKEKDVILGNSWRAWNTVEDSKYQHICKIDNGVTPELDFVLKRFDIVSTVSGSDPLTVFQDYSVPSSYNITGLIAIDRRKTGTGDTCNLDNFGSFITLRLRSSTPPALRFTALVIGRKIGTISSDSDGESTFAKMILRNKTSVPLPPAASPRKLWSDEWSDEDFNDYVY